MRTKPATIKDVAREAGVAQGTVSKVINGIPVGTEYKAKVNAAIKKLDYRVNSYAKGLKLSKTLTVALIIPNIYNTYFSSLAESVNKELSKRGYRMMLCTTENNPVQERAFASMMQQNQVDGVIALTYSTAVHFPPEIPVIGVDRRYGGGIPCVSSDNYEGGRMAAKKLISLGCRSLAYLCTITNQETEVSKRRDGFCSVCSAEKLDPVICEFVGLPEGCDDAQEVLAFLAGHLHDGKLDYDGLFCVSDSLAYQVNNFLTKNGVRVPQDVQIVGFDGVKKFGYLDCFCSTIVQPVEKLAWTCVDLVLRQDRSNIPSLVVLDVSYAPGGTTRE
jgi:LacI family transcriptional regulator